MIAHARINTGIADAWCYADLLPLKPVISAQHLFNASGISGRLLLKGRFSARRILTCAKQRQQDKLITAQPRNLIPRA